MALEDTIRCMQFPLHNMQMLVPNSAVAEIIGFDQTRQGDGGAGYLGMIAWRGVDVPVVCLEALCRQESYQPSARTRIAVVYNPSGDSALPYLGIMLKDIPRAYLAEQDRLSASMHTAGCPFLATRVDDPSENLVIPDLDAIAQHVSQLRAG